LSINKNFDNTAFLSFCEYWPDDGLFRPKLVASNKIGKAVPLQAWSGPEVSKKLRFPDITMAKEGGKVVSLTQRPPLPPGNTPGTHLC
jgi:hypothetical protein